MRVRYAVPGNEAGCLTSFKAIQQLSSRRHGVGDRARVGGPMRAHRRFDRGIPSKPVPLLCQYAIEVLLVPPAHLIEPWRSRLDRALLCLPF